jgi:hypothetical protein
MATRHRVGNAPGPEGPAAPPAAGVLLGPDFGRAYWLQQHDGRRRSPLFLRNKSFLRDEILLPRWICRRRGGQRNPLEVHHMFEWALWRLRDPARVTRILEVLEFYEEGYLATAGPHRAALENALEAAKRSGPLRSPDDIRHLVVLCQRHHRSHAAGAHIINFPLWLALAAVRRDTRPGPAALGRLTRALRCIDEAVADVVRIQG